MSPVAFQNFRSTQTGLDLNGPTIDINENPSNVITQPDAFQTPFGPATGALPIRNTNDNGAVAVSGFRDDDNKADLVLALPLNTTVGDVSADVRGSGTNKVATDIGATTSTLESNLYGTSYRFREAGADYIRFSDAQDWYFNGDFTVEWLFYFTGSAGSRAETIISQWEGTITSGVERNFLILRETDGTIRGLVCRSNTVAYQISSNSSLITDRWYHIAMVLDGTTLSLYVNGVLQESKTVAGNANNSGLKLMVGARDDGNGEGMDFLQYVTYIQDVRIYKGVAKYTSDFIPAFTTPDLITSSWVGIATFVGTASANLGTPNRPGASPISGSFVYQWYDDNGKMSDSTNVTGTATTALTVKNLQSPTDNGKSFYLEVGYASGTYDSAGRGVGNALNGPLNTTSASLTVIPEVTISPQPVGVQIGQGEITTFTSGATTTDTTYGDLTYYWTVDGEVVVDEGRSGAITGNYASGATTPTLEIKKMTVGISTVQFHAYQDAAGYRVESKSVGVAFTGVTPRSMVKLEAYTAATNQQKILEQNIGQDGAFTLDNNTFGSDYGIIQFYSPEENYNIRMTISASKGADNGIYEGGGGGKSVIDFRILKNIEYTLIGVSNNSSIFLYRGAQLMAVVGQGGDAGLTANGGGGGGINMAGGNGSGKDGGSGGARVAPGNFSLTGQWGSVFSTNPNFTRYEGDIIATTPNGGRTISCSRGTYWINQGIGACEDNSTSAIQYRYIDGTVASGSAEITRGFKPGYTVTETSGLAITDGGNGGNGATGGEGGVAGSGGGGGSGYSDDTFDLKSSELGGSTSVSSTVKFEIDI